MEDGGKEEETKEAGKKTREQIRAFTLLHTVFLKPQSKRIWMRKPSNQRGNSILLIYKFMSQLEVLVSQLEVLVSQLWQNLDQFMGIMSQSGLNMSQLFILPQTEACSPQML
jgi:TATA-binding protein-associated factor Taf7